MIECPLPSNIPRTGIVTFYCKIREIDGYNPGYVAAEIRSTGDHVGVSPYGRVKVEAHPSLETFDITYEEVPDSGPLSLYIQNTGLGSSIIPHFILDYLAVRIPTTPSLKLNRSNSRARFTR